MLSPCAFALTEAIASGDTKAAADAIAKVSSPDLDWF
jgi:hypothetical protein